MAEYIYALFDNTFLSHGKVSHRTARRSGVGLRSIAALGKEDR